MKGLGADDERLHAEDVASAKHTTVGVEASMIEVDVLTGDTLLYEIKADGADFIVSDGAVVARDENLTNLAHLVQGDGSISAI